MSASPNLRWLPAVLLLAACQPSTSVDQSGLALSTALPAPAWVVLTLTPLPPTATLVPSPETPTPTLASTATELVLATLAPVAPTLLPPAPTAIVLFASDGSVDAAEQAAVDLTNAYRVAAGLAPLVASPVLMNIARARATDMAARGYFGHTDPVTGEHMARGMAAAAGFIGAVGENLYWTGRPLAQTPSESIGWFMTDASHAANILKTTFAYLGIGIAPGAPGTWILSQVFAAP